MRHVRSVLYALVLAPAVWILCGVGFTQDLTGRAQGGGTVETGIALLLLILAGAAYAILIFSPISPLGPALFGLVFLGVTGWALVAPDSYAGVWPAGITKDGFDLSRPGYALGALLAVPMLCTALSARRWAGFEPVRLPLIGTLGRARGAVPAPGTPVAAERTAVITDADATEVMTLPPPMPAPPGQVAPSPLWPGGQADPSPSGYQRPPQQDEPTAVVVTAPAAATDEPTAIVTPADEPTAIVVPADKSDAADEPTAIVVQADKADEADEPTAIVVQADKSDGADEPTVAAAPADDEPTVAASAAEKPTAATATADEPTQVTAGAEEPTASVAPADEPTVFVVNAAGEATAGQGEEKTEAGGQADDAPAPSTPFDPAPSAAVGNDEPTEAHTEDLVPGDEPTRDVTPDEPTRDIAAGNEPTTDIAKDEATVDVAKDEATVDVAAGNEATSDIAKDDATLDIAADNEATSDIAKDEATVDVAAGNEATTDIAKDDATVDVAADDAATKDVAGEAETRDVAASDDRTRDMAAATAATAAREPGTGRDDDVRTRDLSAAAAALASELDGERTQVIKVPDALRTGGPGERTQVIYRRDPANDLSPEEAARARAAAEQTARDKIAQERARQAFRDRAAQERSRQAFSERAAQEAREHGEATKVIDLNAYRGQPPADATQVLPDIPGDQTQRLPWAGTPGERSGTGTVEPPGDHTQVLSFPVPARDEPAPARQDEPRAPSILGEEQPDPAADPTTRLVTPDLEAADRTATADAGARRTRSVMDLERPADESADDTTRLNIPAPRRPQDDDEPTTRL